MSWRPWSNDAVGTGRSTAHVPGVVVENDTATRGEHARSCGAARLHPGDGDFTRLRVAPPTEQGGLGPLWFPFVLPRPAFAGQVMTVRLRMNTHTGSAVVYPYALCDGAVTRGEPVEVTTAGQWLTVSIPVPARSSRWAVCGFGLTVDDDGLSASGVLTDADTVFDEDGVSFLLSTASAPAEVQLPDPAGDGSFAQYIGHVTPSGGGQIAVHYPPPPRDIKPGAGLTGLVLPRVQVESWTVTLRGAELEPDPGTFDGQICTADDLPRLRQRTLATWAGNSEWARVDADSIGFYGRPGHEDEEAAAALLPVHQRSRGYTAAALIRAWRGPRAVGIKLSAEELDGTPLSSATFGTETTGGGGVQTMPGFAALQGVSASWTARDGMLSADVERYQLAVASLGFDAPTTPTEYIARVEVDFGALKGHVAAVSIVGTVRIDDTTPGVIVLGIATVWEGDDFDDPPPSGDIRIGDIFITTDNDWEYEWDGSVWRVRVASVATWSARPLPATLPAGAGLDAESRVTVATVGRRSGVGFRWSAADSMWDLAEHGLTLEDCFASATAGSRLVSWSPYQRAGMVYTGTAPASTVTALRDDSANLLHTSGTTSRIEIVDGWPAQVTRRSHGENNRVLSTNIFSNVSAATFMIVCQRIAAPDGLGNAMAVTQSDTGNVYIDATSIATTGVIQFRARRNAADGIVVLDSGVNPGEGAWIAVITRANFATGAINGYLNNINAFSGSIPGTPGNTPTAANIDISIGSAAGQFNNWRRRLIALREGTMTDDDVALAMAILRSIRDL